MVFDIFVVGKHSTEGGCSWGRLRVGVNLLFLVRVNDCLLDVQLEYLLRSHLVSSRSSSDGNESVESLVPTNSTLLMQPSCISSLGGKLCIWCICDAICHVSDLRSSICRTRR